MGYLDQLRKYESTFKNSSEVIRERKRYDEFPDGEYTMKMDEVYLNENKFTNTPQITWKLQVVDGEYAGRYVFKNSQLDSEDRVKWLKQDLSRCGSTIDSVDKLEEALESLVDRCILVRLKSKQANNGKTYQNVYIQKEVPVPDIGSDLPF